jgi:DNA-binding NtrC family response regulator
MDMDDALFELVISPAPGALPVRMPVSKRITTIGSDTDADIRLVTVPKHWVVVHREADALSVRSIAGGTAHRLEPGERLDIDGVTIAAERDLPADSRERAVEHLVGHLTGVRSPDRALQLILEGLIAAAGADTGAVILTQDAEYTVAAARDSEGNVLQDAADLLSDTIVRDVLGTGQRVCLTNVASNDRYARVPSVTSMQLRSVMCLPMRIEGRTLGAVFLGKQARRVPFSERVAAELKMLTSMAIPFLAQLRRAEDPATQDSLLGDSEPMVAVRRLVSRVAPSDLTVLILGESGTGKELVARAIHAASPRASRPLIAINCAAVPESLLDAELFGYSKGSFTGAHGDRAGLIEAAHGSTLFLDEVGDMPLTMQSALLRVLEQREVKRLGENHPRKVDFRLIAATNCDLAADVADGKFRKDLLFRIKEMTIDVPPLSERGDDVLLLARCFLRQAEQQLQLPLHSLAPDTEARLRAHPWPGNVRELKATMRRAAILADDRVVGPADLHLDGDEPPADAGAVETPLGDVSRPLNEARDEFVRRYVAAAVERCGGNREDAAKALGIGVRTLYRYLP